MRRVAQPNKARQHAAAGPFPSKKTTENCVSLTINSWAFVPEPEDDEPCFMTYRLKGVVDGQPFDIKASMEIDGRDAEREQYAGPEIAWDGDEDARRRWDELLVQFEEVPDLVDDMDKRTNGD